MPGAFFNKLQKDLDEKDTVITQAELKQPTKPIDLSHLKPNKRIRGD